jgi:hypothetical protein
MGATGWKYFVPYETDILAALQRLRDNVFTRDAYTFGHGLPKKDFDARLKRLLPAYEASMKESLARAEDTSLPENQRAAQRAVAEHMKREIAKFSGGASQTKQKPKTIDELLKQQAENGTHSILDTPTISTKPKFGAINPFPISKLSEYFGSETPSHAKIQQTFESGALEQFVSKKWQGIYIIAYRDGSPHEIFFAGCSGD